VGVRLNRTSHQAEVGQFRDDEGGFARRRKGTPVTGEITPDQSGFRGEKSVTALDDG
jgi:hypothetical protein